MIRVKSIAAIFCAGIAMFAATPACANSDTYSSPDWDEIAAEIKDLPPDFRYGRPPQSVLETIRQHVVPAPNSPESWSIISALDRPSLTEAERRDGLLHMSGRVYDPLGLIDLVVGADSSYDNVDTTAKIEISGTLSSSLPMDGIAIKYRTLSGTVPTPLFSNVPKNDYDCQISGSAATSVVKHCTESYRIVTGNAVKDLGPNYQPFRTPDERPQITVTDVTYKFDPRFGIFSKDADMLSGAFDWKIGDQPWHSQTVSAGLSKPQKEHARALFSRGFDLYKAGDLTGARALVESGLKIDPGNYLGWFTLAEIARSTVVQNPDKYSDARMWGDAAVKVYYRHTIDLAPNSPEAVLAKGYLDALH